MEFILPRGDGRSRLPLVVTPSAGVTVGTFGRGVEVIVVGSLLKSVPNGVVDLGLRVRLMENGRH